MTAATAAAAAERLADAIRDQVRAYSHAFPEDVPAFVAGHVEGATSPKLQGVDPATAHAVMDPALDRLLTLPGSHALNIQFTGQDAATLALWGQHRYVYDVDPDLITELGKSADDDTVIPDGLFTRLPHPDPFIAFPRPLELPLLSLRPDERPGATQRIEGVMVTGRVPTIHGAMQRSTADPNSTHIGLLFAATIWNAEGTPRTLHGGTPDMILTRVTIPSGGQVGPMLAEVLNRFTPNADLDGVDDLVPVMVREAIAALIYLCSVNSELRPVPAPVCKRLAAQASNRKAKPARIIEVGYQVGAALRAYRRRDAQARGQATGRKVRPHVRRSHFHTYWTGPGKPGQRTQNYVKWLPPIPIHATDDPAAKTTVIGVRNA